MGLFQKADIVKSKYIIAIVADINAGNKIKVKGNKSYVFKKTDTIKLLEKFQKEPLKYEKYIYEDGIHKSIFESKDTKLRFIDIDKSQYSGISSSRNALGKKLANAGELATVKSLTFDIKTPKDTGQKLFEDDPKAFLDWLITFQYTRQAVESIISGKITSYDILHDATDTSDFSKVISNFCKKIKTTKDSWNPADIFLIKKGKINSIVKELDNIVSTYSVVDGLVDMFNSKLYEFYLDKILYPISLKQLVNPNPSIDFVNEPGKTVLAHYDISINNFNCNLSLTGKEIGLFTFKNNDTGKIINLQVRGFPHGYGTAQTEITADGSPTGGRLGKISTSVIDRIMDQYKDERIKSISFFGKAPKYLSNLGKKEIDIIYEWYLTVVNNSKVKDQNKISLTDLHNLIEEAKGSIEFAENICMKIQGLKMMNFFIKNEANLSDIMNKMINGAKKISNDNGFFIKIY